MAFTYSGNPMGEGKDAVRFMLGDTNECDILFHDGEIAYLLSESGGSSVMAAIRGCEILIAKFARQCDQTVGSVSVSWSQRSKQMQQVLSNLRTRLAINSGGMWAGGIYRSDKIAQRNSDLVTPKFTKDMMDSTDSSEPVPGVTGDDQY